MRAVALHCQEPIVVLSADTKAITFNKKAKTGKKAWLVCWRDGQHLELLKGKVAQDRRHGRGRQGPARMAGHASAGGPVQGATPRSNRSVARSGRARDSGEASALNALSVRSDVAPQMRRCTLRGVSPDLSRHGARHPCMATSGSVCAVRRSGNGSVSRRANFGGSRLWSEEGRGGRSRWGHGGDAAMWGTPPPQGRGRSPREGRAAAFHATASAPKASGASGCSRLTDATDKDLAELLLRHEPVEGKQWKWTLTLSASANGTLRPLRTWPCAEARTARSW